MLRAVAPIVPILLCACGARTGLLYEVSESEPDASADAAVDAAIDAGEDAGESCEVTPFEPPVQENDPLSSI